MAGFSGTKLLIRCERNVLFQSKLFSEKLQKPKYLLRFKHDLSKPVRSAVVNEIKTPLVIEETVQRVKLKNGEVRIGVHCCAVNASDLLMCNGLSEIKREVPFVPGFEIAGEIIEISKSVESEAAGDESGDEEDAEIKVGDRVVALNKEKLHGFSDECIVEAKDVFHIPASLSYKVAAALPDSYSTALLGLGRRAKVKEKNTVLITAAAGGLGLAAVDIAANVYKAKVIGVCGTEDKASLVREKGAWTALTYTTAKSLRDKVLEVSGGKGADVVLDAVGGDIFKNAMACVAPEGKFIVAGFASRDVPNLPMSDLLQLPSFSLIGVSLTNYRNNVFKIYRRSVKDVIELYEQGLISPHISELLTLDEVNEALKHLEDRRTTGKVILEINK